MELYYAVSGLTILSEKLSRDNVDNVIKTVQNTLRKDDSLWKYGLFHSFVLSLIQSLSRQRLSKEYIF